jgi:hypothetical protein
LVSGNKELFDETEIVGLRIISAAQALAALGL